LGGIKSNVQNPFNHETNMTDSPRDQFKDDALFQKAALGVDIEHFIHEDRIGMYLMRRAEEARTAATVAWARTDPEDTLAIRELQWQYSIPDLIVTWLREAIAEGQVAERNIELEELRSR
jgi:hypothetical protein